MKKVFALLFAVTVLLCGCDALPSNCVMLPSCFDATVKVSFDDTEYEAMVTRYADRYWVVEFTAPDTVKGLIFTVEGDDTEISFNGLHFTFDTEKFPVGSVVSILIDSLDRLIPLQHEIVEGELSDFVTGQVEDMSYTMTLDKNGIPLTVELGDSGMKIEFCEFEEHEAVE